MNADKFESSIKLFSIPLKRRDFMLGALAGVGLWATSLFPLKGLIRKRALADLHFGDFEALLGEQFQLYSHTGLSSTVQLAAVKASPFQTTRAMSPGQACFSLAFLAPKGHGFSQETYTFAHPKLGHFDLFIVPTQPVEQETRYIAIINRI